MKNFKFKFGLVVTLIAVAALAVFGGSHVTDAVTGMVAGAQNINLSEFGKYIIAPAPLVTIFAKTVEEKIFPDNAFYMRSMDDSEFVVETGTGARVEYPVAGVNPNVEINRTVLPAPISERVDDSNGYDLDEFTTNPTLIRHTESLIVNYNKRASVLRGHNETLNTSIANRFANIWAPDGADNIVRTTGANRAAAVALGATGTRKAVTEADIISVANVFDRMNVDPNSRYCCLPADMIQDLRGIDNFKRQDALGYSNIPSGVIARIHGFWVYARDYMALYDNTATPVKKASGAAVAATDHLSGLFWHEQYVTRAKGSVKAFSDEDKPEYYGSIFSFLARAGGKQRKDKLGIVSLVQATGA